MLNTPPHDERQMLFKVLPAVKEVRSLHRVEMDWFATIETWPGFNKQPVALQILIIATRFDPFISRFAVQLTDAMTAIASWYSFDVVSGTWIKSDVSPGWIDAHLNNAALPSQGS